MLNTSMVYPMAGMVALTFIYSLYMLSTRIQAVKKGEVKVGYFKTFTEGTPPMSVVQANRHYANLFELPVIFYITCLVTMVMGIESSFGFYCAWGFVLARALHAYIHSARNKLRPRMLSFAAGWIFLIAMWVQILKFV